MLEGISATEVWWSDIQPWEVAERGAVAVAYAVRAGDRGIELIAPGALVALEVEAGLLLLDQARWADAAVNAQRSGTYLALRVQNPRHTPAR